MPNQNENNVNYDDLAMFHGDTSFQLAIARKTISRQQAEIEVLKKEVQKLQSEITSK